MTVTFKNAPLVELIAELRWGDTPPIMPQAPQIVMQGVGPDLDQFFMRLSSEVDRHGFQRADRLVPPGFPLFPYQPVYRFRKDGANVPAVLFQAGHGLFSVHGVPPYRSWESISDTVRIGITSLLKARSPSESDASFNVVTLRYINAFGPSLTGNRSIEAFIDEVLGFEIKLPIGVSKHIKIGSKPKPHIQFSFLLTDGATMALLVGEGTVQNDKKIIMDMTVTCGEPVAPDIEILMTAFTSARNTIHDIFIELTKPIRDLLEPIEQKADA